MARNLISMVLLLVFGVPAGGISVTQQSEPGVCISTNLDDARHVFHRTWFEEADEREPADSYAVHFLGFTLNDLGRHDEG